MVIFPTELVILLPLHLICQIHSWQILKGIIFSLCVG